MIVQGGDVLLNAKVLGGLRKVQLHLHEIGRGLSAVQASGGNLLLKLSGLVNDKMQTSESNLQNLELRNAILSRQH
jgi:hypothetical protein